LQAHLPFEKNGPFSPTALYLLNFTPIIGGVNEHTQRLLQIIQTENESMYEDRICEAFHAWVCDDAVRATLSEISQQAMLSIRQDVAKRLEPVEIGIGAEAVRRQLTRETVNGYRNVLGMAHGITLTEESLTEHLRNALTRRAAQASQDDLAAVYRHLRDSLSQ